VNPKIKSLLFLFFIFSCLLLISINPIKVLYPAPTDDEITYYQPASNGIHNQGISYLQYHPDTKPLPFIYIFYLLDGSIFYTRLLNYILIGITTYFIFKSTGSKLAILYPLIPIFLNGVTLTAEIIKAMFVIISFYYIRYNGFFIGLATIFNPFSILYGVLLNKKNFLYFIIICELFAALLLYLGLFFPYLFWLIQYEQITESQTINWMTLLFLVIFFIIGSKDKTTLKYTILSVIPVLTRPYFNWYYIVPYTILFVGFLLQEKPTKGKH
jgi:hypothetical protein